MLSIGNIATAVFIRSHDLYVGYMGEPCKNGPKESCRPTAQAVLDGGCVFESPKCDKYVWRPGSSRTRWGSFTAPALLQTLTAIGEGFYF